MQPSRKALEVSQVQVGGRLAPRWSEADQDFSCLDVRFRSRAEPGLATGRSWPATGSGLAAWREGKRQRTVWCHGGNVGPAGSARRGRSRPRGRRGIRRARRQEPGRQGGSSAASCSPMPEGRAADEAMGLAVGFNVSSSAQGSRRRSTSPSPAGSPAGDARSSPGRPLGGAIGDGDDDAL